MIEKYDRTNLIQQSTVWTEELTYPLFYGRKACVVIPCQNRNQYLTPCLHAWLSQTYDNFEIILVDYDSDKSTVNKVMAVADKFSASVSINPENNDQNYKDYSKISIFQIKDVSHWNMSHALNYGIRRSTSHVVSVAGCDTMPQSHYLETAMHVVDENRIASVWCGRVTFPRVLWYQINGYQELCTGWGGEDSDFRFRALRTGYNILEIDKNLCPSIWHPRDPKTKEPTSSNLDRCIRYANFHGLVGNYYKFPGEDKPVTEKNTGGHYVYISYLSEPVVFEGGITKSCCYAGLLGNMTYYYVVPDKTDNNDNFNETIKAATIETKRVYVDDSIWYILENINTICDKVEAKK